MFKIGKLHDWFFCGLLAAVLAVQVVNLSRRGDFVTSDELKKEIQRVQTQQKVPKNNSIAKEEDRHPKMVDVPIREKCSIPSGVTTFRAGDEWCIYYCGMIFSAGDVSPFDIGKILVIRPNLIRTEVADYSGVSHNGAGIGNPSN